MKYQLTITDYDNNVLTFDSIDYRFSSFHRFDLNYIFDIKNIHDHTKGYATVIPMVSINDPSIKSSITVFFSKDFEHNELVITSFSGKILFKKIDWNNDDKEYYVREICL